MSARAWLAPPLGDRRVGLKGPRAAALLAEAGLNVPARANSWTPLRDADRDDSPNVVARLGHSEFFIEVAGDSPAIDALERQLAAAVPGAWPVLRADSGIVLGGPGACDVLAQVCNVDFAALDLAARGVVMTLAIGVGVLVLPQATLATPEYRIWCDPSFGTYLRCELEKRIEGEIPMERA